MIEKDHKMTRIIIVLTFNYLSFEQQVKKLSMSPSSESKFCISAGTSIRYTRVLKSGLFFKQPFYPGNPFIWTPRVFGVIKLFENFFFDCFE